VGYGGLEELWAEASTGGPAEGLVTMVLEGGGEVTVVNEETEESSSHLHIEITKRT
jgi:hypothetical protein